MPRRCRWQGVHLLCHPKPKQQLRCRIREAARDLCTMITCRLLSRLNWQLWPSDKAICTADLLEARQNRRGRAATQNRVMASGVERMPGSVPSHELPSQEHQRRCWSWWQLFCCLALCTLPLTWRELSSDSSSLPKPMSPILAVPPPPASSTLLDFRSLHQRSRLHNEGQTLTVKSTVTRVANPDCTRAMHHIPQRHGA